MKKLSFLDYPVMFLALLAGLFIFLFDSNFHISVKMMLAITSIACCLSVLRNRLSRGAFIGFAAGLICMASAAFIYVMLLHQNGAGH